jgi:hypothetical protein
MELQLMTAKKDMELQMMKMDLMTAKKDMEKELELVKKDLQFAERDKFRFEAELKMKSSEHEAVTTIRPLLVAGAFASCSSALTATDACRQLANFITKNGVLSKTASQDLLRLENDPQLQKAVENELKDIFHEFSKPAHFVSKSVINGIVCGGALPLRAACALLFLELQRQSAVKYEVVYADEHYKKLCTLSDGKVI